MELLHFTTCFNVTISLVSMALCGILLIKLDEIRKLLMEQRQPVPPAKLGLTESEPPNLNQVSTLRKIKPIVMDEEKAFHLERQEREHRKPTI